VLVVVPWLKFKDPKDMYVRDSLHTLIGFLKLSWSLFMGYFPYVKEKVGLKLTIHSQLERYQLLPLDSSFLSLPGGYSFLK